MATILEAGPARQWLSVTPSDTVNLPTGCRGLFITVAGDVVLVGSDDVAVTFAGIAAATVLPLGPKRVNSTSTTATGIKALY